MKRSIPTSFTAPLSPRRQRPATASPSAAVGVAAPVGPTTPATPATPAAPRTWDAPLPLLETQGKTASLLLAGYIFILASLAHEFLVFYAKLDFPWVSAAFAVVCAAFVFSSGNHLRFLRSPFALAWVALLVWWFLTGATGTYRTRSLGYMFPYALRIHTIPLIFCALTRTPESVKRLLYGAGFGLLWILTACTLWGQVQDERFIVPQTSLGNANDLGLRILLMGCLSLVFWGGGLVQRIIMVLTAPVILYYVLKTGSRSNLIILTVLWCICFLFLPVRKKVAFVIVSVLVPVLAFPLLPSGTVNRLFTFFSVSGQMQTEREYQLQQYAVDSTNARLLLQERALALTMRNPLLGVGPLNFEDAVEAMVREETGRKSGWQVAHNSYLDISSETGVPGLLLYVWIIGSCLVTNFRNFRRFPGKPALVTFAIFLANVVYAVGILFCSIAYDYYLALIVGLTAANHLVLHQRPATPVARPATP